jgi:hypothetical protein
MPATIADPGEPLSTIQRRQQIAAILALGILRYCRISRLAGSVEEGFAGAGFVFGFQVE